MTYFNSLIGAMPPIRKVNTFLLFAWIFTAPLSAVAGRPSHSADFNLPSSSISSLILLCPSDLTVGFSGNNCTANVSFPMPQVVSTGCDGAVTVKVNSLLGTGNGTFWGVSEGKYQINCEAFNSCGDTAFCKFYITVRDTKKPTLVLKAGLHGNITPNGMVRFVARQFNQNSSDNCTPNAQLQFSFSANPADSVRNFDCKQLGQNNLQIFVFDASGNKSSGLTTVTVMDGMGYCTSTDWSGVVKTPSGKVLDEVKMSLQGAGFSEVTYTNEEGIYAFEGLAVGEDFHLVPFKNDNPLNGINSYDLKMLNDHILGTKLLDSPYKIIAADVNKSGKVTTADIVALRRLILGETQDFVGNTSWRFVPESYVFPNAMNPFEPAFPESISIPNLQYELFAQNFVAVKTGDLNYSAVNNFNPLGGEDRSENFSKLFLITENHHFTKGELFEVPIQIAAQTFSPDAFQLTLNMDMNQLELITATPGNLSGMGFENMGLSRQAQGSLSLAWNKKTAVHRDSNTVIFAKFSAKQDGNLADALSIGSQVTDAVAFDKEGKMYAIELNFKEQYEAAGGVELSQNSPNPFIEMTLVRFNLPTAGSATLSIFDSKGKLVFSKTSDYEAGEQQHLVNRTDLPGAGLYAYRIQTAYGSATRKMVMF